MFLEWSKERYEAQFSIYADNLAGRSYERLYVAEYPLSILFYSPSLFFLSFLSSLCPELPIDVVYTWVNGSDPKLIKELRRLKQDLEKKFATLSVSKHSSVTTALNTAGINTMTHHTQ